MKRAIQAIALFFITLFIFVSPRTLSGEIKLLEELEFAPKQDRLLFPRDVCLTEDGLFLVTDQHAGDVKIYSKDEKTLTLRLVGKIVVGKPGSEKLQYPTYCFYNPLESRFGVIDYVKREILLYDRLGKVNFFHMWTIDCPYLADGIQLIGNELFISGFTLDSRNNGYDLYSIDLESGQTTFLLPSYRKYGLDSPAEYNEKYMNGVGIRMLGISGWFAVQDDFAYFAWEGDLKIIKMDVKSGREVPFERAVRKHSPYKRPSTSPNFSALLEGYKAKDPEIIRREKDKMFFVRHVFTNSKYVYVVYEGPVNQRSRFRLQVYNLRGDSVANSPIPGQPGTPMFFDRKCNTLYSISKSGKNNYSVLKYEISNK
ncbi:MAG: hypothetical protein KAT34_16270 [Candidatus Aminicenantes bacterium]|nr:hypothetical protein [Candidatus Aminicenantes bacterium]